MLTVMLLLAAFAMVHSWLAGPNIKRAIRRKIGDRAYYGWYRLAYNVFAVVTLAPAAIIGIASNRQVVWQIEGLPAFILLAVQIAGVIGVIVSLLQIDTLRFAGLTQVRAFLAGEPLPLPEEPLQVGGVYGIVRHPLYLFSLLAIWPFATMTSGLLAFNIASTLYFIAGSLLEERRLAAAFGDRYRAYQADVPWLIPRIRH